MKEDFQIKRVAKTSCVDLLVKHHYLSNISKGFKSKVNYGLFYREELVGVCIFTGFPVPELVVGCFGLERTDQGGFWELSRLCLDPSVQSEEHNLASWFVSRCLKLLRQEEQVRAVLSYADADFHSGTVYRACNFKYYGLSAAKSDYWIPDENGKLVKLSRGKTKDQGGVWIPRSRKHRFLLTYDKKLKVLWNEE
jgi:hypothetical protein